MKRSTFNVTVAVGFLAVALGILVARANPATSYEPSIYAGTPLITWFGFALGLAIAVATALTCRGREQAFGIALGGMTVTSIISLPVIRNYHFAGMGDALTHLGWTRDIIASEMAPHQLFYPAIHTIATVFHYVGGVPIERGLLFGMVVLFVPFLIFIPLTVREITGTDAAVGLAAIVSWMVLPINNVATHMGIHTNSNALFMVPVVIFAAIAYLRRRATIERLPFGLSPFSALIYLTGIGLLLVHPQQMVNVVILIGAISVVQYFARRQFSDHPVLDHPTMYAHTVVLGGLFAIWAVSNERFRDALTGLVVGVLTEDIGGGAEVDQRGTSLTEIGGSLGELFVKMFLAATVVGLIVGVFLLLVWLGRSRLDSETRPFVNYLSFGLVPLTGMFVLYFVGTPTMAFRQVGFIYVVLTILAGIALAYGFGGLSNLVSRPASNTVAGVLLGTCLVLGLMTVFASPIIYSPTQHVTNEQMSGYETALTHGDVDRPLVGMGYDPFRFDHGIKGVEGEDSPTAARTASGTIDEEAFGSGEYDRAYHDVSYYFAVTNFDRVREFQVYEELNYDRESLEELETYDGADKVVSNDEFQLYDVEGAE
ncbi:hypothetical protein [Haloterrigena alkaliphila]|uniref:hypothetical protein n=1 Tax=Haloterrigena alkaliphila TaxID=2816475 RepID=UPI001D000965|nr:hypothetical protein [Haloterrigena alkaliphila]UHQ95330.1 hypothetical protein J0X25_20905 [Haloterrigena alkaliphila]